MPTHPGTPYMEVLPIAGREMRVSGRKRLRRAQDHREPSQAVWAAYWGYDSCGPGGILDRLFTALRIPQKSWGGLKRLPEVGGISYERRHSYMHLVSNFLQVARPLTHMSLSI